MEIVENSLMWLGIHDDYLGIYLFCTYYLLFTLFAECTGGVSQMGLFVCGLNLGWLFYLNVNNFLYNHKCQVTQLYNYQLNHLIVVPCVE
jgi:hypothetical protein